MSGMREQRRLVQYDGQLVVRMRCLRFKRNRPPFPQIRQLMDWRKSRVTVSVVHGSSVLSITSGFDAIAYHMLVANRPV